jgi:hypothetical protein
VPLEIEVGDIHLMAQASHLKATLGESDLDARHPLLNQVVLVSRRA